MVMGTAIRRISVVFLLGASVLPAERTLAAERVDGPVTAEVLRVIDGDSIEIKARLWLGLDLTVQVRIRGIDTPEMRGDCIAEKALAAAARDRLAEISGETIRLTNIEGDKYAGRVDADAIAADGTDLRTAMLSSGLARPYDGRERLDWCPVGALCIEPK